MDLESLFLDAIERLDVAERDRYVREACGDNLALLSELQSLLDAHDRESPLDRPLIDTPNARWPDTISSISAVPEVIAGRYRIGATLGQGGMGTVYEAEQLEPVRRTVAIKLIRSGLDSARVLARFEVERQVLAVMNHPGIAKVFDAGTLPSGLPFFVMELVRGKPLTEFCDEHRLSIEERLRLFIAVCDAVQHAHQKAIIHRDLKPGNVLVAMTDGRPSPTVIDFGLAKALTGGVVPDLTHDGVPSIQGTPLYMAPEQAAGQSVDIDTRADLYALGVILYELLTGSTPIPRESAISSRYDELMRMIREMDPPTPTKRMRSDPRLAERASLCRTSVDRLVSAATGEIDWIVMKAIAKERERRYSSANDLAHDIERFLAHQPVEACPPSRRYVARKFIRRNRKAVLAVSCMVVALVTGVIGATWGLWQATAARKAEREQREIAEEAEAKATAEAQRASKEAAAADQVSSFLSNLFEPRDRLAFGSANLGFRDPAQGETMRARELLDRGIARLKSDGGLKEQPLVRARLLHEVASISIGIGQSSAARELADEALAIRQSQLHSEHPDLLKTLRVVALLDYLDGDYETCLARLRQVIDLLNRTSGSDTLDMAETETLLALAIAFVDRTEAIPLLQHSYEVTRGKLGPTDTRTLSAGAMLAYIKAAREPIAAITLARQLQRDLESGPGNPELANLMRLAFKACIATAGNNELPATREFVEQLVVVFGDRHYMTFYAKLRLAGLLYDSGGNDLGVLREAARLYAQMATHGPRWQRNHCLFHLGRTQFRLRDFADAEKSLESSIAEFRKQSLTLSANHLPHGLQMLAWVYHQSKEPEKMAKIEPTLEESVTTARANPHTTPARLGVNLIDLGRYRLAKHGPESALVVLEEAVRVLNQAHGKNDLRTLEAMAFHEAALRRTGKTAEADAIRTELQSRSSRYVGVAKQEAARIRQLLKGMTPVWR